MNLRIAILTVLRDADLRGAPLNVLTPHVQAQAIGEAWTREEIERELMHLHTQGMVSSQLDTLQVCTRYFITTQGQIALAR